MDLQQYQDINEATYKTLKFINERGHTRGSRNGEATYVNNYQFSIDNVKDRYLHLKGRTSNIYAQLMELVWVLSGTTSIEGLFTFLLPRAPDYSDDGKTWRGGYGARLFNKYSQLDNALEQLIKDPYTRQAVFNIWSHEKDTKIAVNEQGFESTKDTPCSNFGWFWVDRDNRLNMKMHMRSNDCLFGMSHINILEFTVLLEIMYELVKQHHSDIQLGKYYHNVINMHFYENTRSQVEKVLKENSNTEFKRHNLDNFTVIENVKSFSEVQKACSAIYESLNKFYKSDDGFNEVIHDYIRMRDRLGDCLLTQTFLLLISYISENVEYNELFNIKDEIISNNLVYHKINPSLSESLRMSKKTPQYVLDYINNSIQ